LSCCRAETPGMQRGAPSGVLKPRHGVWQASGADTEIRPATAIQSHPASRLTRGRLWRGTRDGEASCFSFYDQRARTIAGLATLWPVLPVVRSPQGRPRNTVARAAQASQHCGPRCLLRAALSAGLATLWPARRRLRNTVACALVEERHSAGLATLWPALPEWHPLQPVQLWQKRNNAYQRHIHGGRGRRTDMLHIHSKAAATLLPELPPP